MSQTNTKALALYAPHINFNRLIKVSAYAALTFTLLTTIVTGYKMETQAYHLLFTSIPENYAIYEQSLLGNPAIPGTTHVDISKQSTEKILQSFSYSEVLKKIWVLESGQGIHDICTTKGK